ncbi:hypothetical protein GBA52_028375 [Prunus armeniaca]|nr:hypothetical protein GBA52_028375 [Prunus armeniaca]
MKSRTTEHQLVYEPLPNNFVPCRPSKVASSDPQQQSKAEVKSSNVPKYNNQNAESECSEGSLSSLATTRKKKTILLMTCG